MRFADMWRTGVQFRFGPGYVDADSVSWEPELPEGLNVRPSTGDGNWRLVPHDDGRAAVTLPDCGFTGRCKGGDFRLFVTGKDMELAILRVEVAKP